MKIIAVSVAALLLFATGASAATTDSPLCRPGASGQMPTFCEPEPKLEPVPKGKPKIEHKHQYNRGKMPPRRPPPQRRYQENPLFLIPSLFGLVAAKAYDRVEDGVVGMYG